MAEQSLKDKAVKGVAWSGIDNVAQFSVTFIVSIILARLLSPDDYGLIGIIAVFTTVCNTIINGGFSSALIRKKDACEKDYNTVFIINLSVSILLYVAIYCCAPLIADFFNRDELVPLTRVSVITIILGALALVQQTRLTKRIDFKTQTIITLISTIGSGVLGILLALLGFGVWALVAQQISLQFLRTILLWCYNRWKPSFQFSKDSFFELFGFGWKMMLSVLIDSIWTQLNQVVVGRFYSPADLGQFTRSNQFASLFSQNLTVVVQRVSYPVLSSIQDNKERMVSAYKRIIKTTMLVSTSGMFILAAVSEPLLYCLIGPKWHDAAVYLPLVCVAGSLYPLHAINLNMLQVLGRSDLFLGIEIIKKTIAIIPILFGIFIGIIPMLYAGIVVGFLCFLLNSFFSGRFLGYSSWMQIKDVAPSYVIASIVAVIIFTFKFVEISYWIVLPLQIIIGLSLIIGICEIIDLPEYKEIKNIVVKTGVKFLSK